MPEYQFFVSDGAPKPANKAMRSHAMKTALRTRAAQTQDPAEGPSGQSESQRTKDSKDNLKGKFRLDSKASSKQRSKDAKPVTEQPSQALGPFIGLQTEKPLWVVDGGLGTGPIQWFANGYVDPFGIIPVPNNSRVEKILKYYLTKFTINLATTDKERPWFGLAMTSPVIMHITLALSATFWISDCKSEDVVVRREGLWQKGETIRVVNRHLRNGEVSDNVIAAVSILANVAGLEGSFEEADMHVKAVARLVGLRGGIQAFKDNPTVARAVNWADIHIAAGVGRRPLMPLIHGLEEVTLPDYIIAEAESPSLSLLDSLAYGSNILKTIFLFLRQAILCKRYKVCVPNGVRIIFNIADCHILDHLSTEPVSPDAHRFKTLLLATHVFIYAVKRQMPKGGAIVSILIERLKLSLQASGVDIRRG
ncbi:putative tachykinin family protein [Phaeoacremonium minimum UCRPA7]|uniref:Putative tachykinin family protein n=1 Tax=Phaeoacremonium minimum (strain UCR-PA7) TaxID=1286976 RepID=R8BYK4_PHAM7|nr:putative tachykinin family protein [Phaeoacremonium minimum UCRPA7]EOO04354.1 putative tachykinin family protein [Phaeoacremonium minimum UCRPA7]